jgi:predicted ATPase/DNA-binding winged helix-turn-helix (wHTH) protein
MPWHFGPFRLDLANACLWRAEQPVALRPKTFDVLVYLVTHAGQLVTKAALFDAIWPKTAVGDGVLKTSMGELRQALGETAQAPQWIATVRGRGYRFVAPVTLVDPTVPTEAPAVRAALLPACAPAPAPRLVAREAEVATLHQWFAKARQGERHLGFITGEAGIGKTTLVDAFVAQVAAQESLWIGHGRCIEQYGAGEAYLPLLEALGQMGRTPDGPHLVALLRQRAPSWLLQMPALLSPAEYEALQRYAGGTMRERMLRELAEAVEGLTAARPCVLVLEDLHWSDMATIEWLAYVARRRGPARLLVLGTYRPVEAIVRAHPIRPMVQELMVHGYGAELPLGEWSEAGVAAYLAQRGAEAGVPAELARVLTERTDGHPLFLVAVVDELIRQGLLRVGPAGWALAGGLDAVTVGVPQSIGHLLERQLAQLRPEDQELLAAASVAGVEFAVAAVAAGVQHAAEDVEAQCDALARRHQLVQARGTAVWPDETVTARYGFRHALYQKLIYERVPVSRRVRWHQQIGTRLEAGYGPQAREMAAELAMHFGRGRDAQRAVLYLQQAADNALRRHADREAISHLNAALEFHKTLPDTRERAQQELALQATQGRALAATQGFGSSEAEQAYTRAWELGRQLGNTSQLCTVLWGLWRLFNARAACQTAQQLGEQLLRLAQCQHDPAIFLGAHCALGGTLLFRGALRRAHAHASQGMALYDPQRHRALAFRYGEDPGVGCHVYGALALWLLGYPDQALTTMHAALAMARELAHPFSLGRVLNGLAFLYGLRREAHAAREQAEAMIALATAQGFPLWVASGTYWHGWALAMQGHSEAGMRQMRQGMAAWDATGTQRPSPVHLAYLAEVYGHGGQADEGLRLLAEALAVVNTTGEYWWEAELHRLTGELLLRQAVPAAPQAETCFHQALAVARRQQAQSWELRAAMGLSRLRERQGKRAEARQLLAEVYDWFTEGFDTADLQEAKALLAEFEG